jgi:dienelactone hydrolase
VTELFHYVTVRARFDTLIFFCGFGFFIPIYCKDAYDAWADMRTWQRAVHFLKEAFGEITYASIEPDDEEIGSKVIAVPYVDVTDGTKLQGYVTFPDSTKWKYPAPAVIILPDWDGVNDYEKKRAILFAEAGYVAFAADIYGADLQMIDEIETRIELVTNYTSNIPLYVSRINAALMTVTNGTIVTDPPTDDEEIVKSNSVALVGYCFGGTGVVQYAFNGGGSEVGNIPFQVGVAYHGGLETLPDVTMNISMYMLIESGGDDAAHGNQVVLEQALNDANAEWEISRYSGVVHGFTVWSDMEDTTTSRALEHSSTSGNNDHRSMQTSTSPYSVIADARSWMATMEILEARMPSMTISDVPTSSNTPNRNNDTNTDNDTSSAGIVAQLYTTMMLWVGLTFMACLFM